MRSRPLEHVDLAVGLDADVHRLDPVRAHPRLGLHVQRDPEPEIAALLARGALLGAELVIADHRRRLLERLRGRDVLERDAARHGVRQLVALEHVAAPQLERVDAELARRDVHHLLAGAGLDLPRPAVRAAPARVRVDARRRPPEVRDAVRAGEHHRGERRRAPGAHHRERAGVVDLVEARREHAAVVVDRHVDGDALEARGVRRDEVLAPVLDPLDRPAEVVGGEHDDLLVAAHVGLQPEPAAHVAHAHPHPVLGHAGDAGAHHAALVGHLGRDPHLEVGAVRVPARDHAPGLHRHLGLALLAERLGEDVRRVGERRVERRVGLRRRLSRDVRA